MNFVNYNPGNITVNATGPQFYGSDLTGAILIIIVLALLIGGIYLVELYLAYKHTPIIPDADRTSLIQTLKTNMDALGAKIAQPGTSLTADDLAKYTDMISEVKSIAVNEPTGIQGFTRGQIATTVIFLLGAAIILIVFSSSPNPNVLNNVLSMMGATLAAVVGFYFGGSKTK